MIEKATIATLIATFLSVGFSGIEDSIDEIQNEATAAASVMQERELRTALEICYSKNDSYPLSYDEGMIRDLYEEDCLMSDRIVYEITYTPSISGQSYKLELK